MANLRCLVISLVIDVADDRYTTNSAWIVHSLTAMPTHNRLEELVLIIYPNQINPTLHGWASQLDLLLSQDRFQPLLRVSIHLTSPNDKSGRPHGFLKDAVEYVVRQMPHLGASGVLRVGWLDRRKDTDTVYSDTISKALDRQRIHAY